MTPEANLAYAAELIRKGKLVAFPTETVYGLGANALDEDAVARIFEAKGRPRTSPLIVHVDSVEMAQTLAGVWPESAELLARIYWPGPLTLVVAKHPGIPDIVTAGLPTVGLRMPAHPMALELIREAGVPIAAPSANRFTELSPTAVAHIPESLADFTLDGGPSTVGIESTVLSLVAEPRLLRPGVIPIDELESLIGPIMIGPIMVGPVVGPIAGPMAIDPAAIGSVAEPTAIEGAHPAPGMHARHYRPHTPLHLGTFPSKGKGAYLRIGHEMPEDPRAYAAALYGTLHHLDTQALDWIAVEVPPDTPEWAGVLDRLRRAAE